MYYLARISRNTSIKKDKDKWVLGPFKKDDAKEIKKRLTVGRGDVKILTIDDEYDEVCFPVGMGRAELEMILKEKVCKFLKVEKDKFKMVDINTANLDGLRDVVDNDRSGGGGSSAKQDRYLG